MEPRSIVTVVPVVLLYRATAAAAAAVTTADNNNTTSTRPICAVPYMAMTRPLASKECWFFLQCPLVRAASPIARGFIPFFGTAARRTRSRTWRCGAPPPPPLSGGARTALGSAHTPVSAQSPAPPCADQMVEYGQARTRGEQHNLVD